MRVSVINPSPSGAVAPCGYIIVKAAVEKMRHTGLLSYYNSVFRIG